MWFKKSKNFFEKKRGETIEHNGETLKLIFPSVKDVEEINDKYGVRRLVSTKEHLEQRLKEKVMDVQVRAALEDRLITTVYDLNDSVLKASREVLTNTITNKPQTYVESLDSYSFNILQQKVNLLFFDMPLDDMYFDIFNTLKVEVQTHIPDEGISKKDLLERMDGIEKACLELKKKEIVLRNVS